MTFPQSQRIITMGLQSLPQPSIFCVCVFVEAASIRNKKESPPPQKKNASKSNPVFFLCLAKTPPTVDRNSSHVMDFRFIFTLPPLFYFYSFPSRSLLSPLSPDCWRLVTCHQMPTSQSTLLNQSIPSHIPNAQTDLSHPCRPPTRHICGGQGV